MKLPVYEEDHNDPAKLAERTSVGGPLQSIIFYNEAIRRLANIGLKWFRFGEFTMHDYGCADGFGTAVLASEFPLAKVTGIDISEMYINRARELFPTLDWKVGDITDPQDECDVIWTSHTIEHVEDPIGAVEKLCAKAREAVIVIVPPVIKGDKSHVDAQPTDEFLKDLRDRLLDRIITDDTYLTWRYNVNWKNPNNRLLKERSFLFILKGGE